ncbi:MAG: bifunctional 3-phosphoshikimate 1-carboxyvinyltransferase/cytidylate kinase [Betaproteobacteria bacterium]|nr:bifunctional 3-phosphoshikimate 1-carboxyvinyltransferase/cytidylate kinase [Betaproteobacteria bacterium]
MSAYPDHLDLGPLDRAAGTVRLPGSKSISNRTLLLAALADGRTQIHNLLASDDVDRMLEALSLLGVKITRSRQDVVAVEGCNGSFPAKQADLFLGNAGTALRPLTAVLAMCGGHYKLSGVPRMHERPIGDLVDALRSLGADIHYLGNEGYPPLEIRPGTPRSGSKVRIRGDVSSQFLTALLMALPLADRQITIEVTGELVSKPYIDITLDLMARFGVTIERNGWSSFLIPADSRLTSPGDVYVEGDASGASYFLAAGAIGGGPVRVEGVGRGSIQGDVGFADALAQMGARIEMHENWIDSAAPATGRLRAFDLDLNSIPDAAMTLAVAALFADGTSRLRNIGSWRVKETDRIAAMATELRKLGARVEEGPDFLTVTPPSCSRLAHGAAIDTYDDHRIAMCFSLAALGGVKVRINEPGCVAKTFPDYFERFAEVTSKSSAPVIAIDGPSASGKGVVAQRVAEHLGFRYLDSGSLYRLVALAALRDRVDVKDADSLGEIARTLPAQFSEGKILLNGEDVTDAIRAEAVSRAASEVAAFPSVRQGLMRRQQAFRRDPGLVAEGRDMASVVFPDAVLKVFLTASAEERALRRYKQLIEKGFDATLSTLLQDIRQRDARDSERSVAPLRKSVDAQIIDTTGLSIQEVVARILQWFESASRKVPSR